MTYSVRQWRRRLTPVVAEAVREHFPARVDQQRFLAKQHYAAQGVLRDRYGDEFECILNDLVLKAIDQIEKES